MIECRVASVGDTHEVARRLAGALRSGDLVLLVGDLGAGKTTFTQGLGSGLGIEDQITSPTFILVRTYEAALPLHHVDVYRLDRLQEVIDLGLMEILDEGGVAVIEWGDLATPVLPRDFLEIRIDFDTEDDDARKLKLNCVGSKWSVREDEIRRVLKGDDQ